mmetsp:Transcript_12830/g.25649  ORF Transcript_12830/g.25649 Transcript_12830/m.25649 type:complete len:101 (-) Transcript_12830:382-684(-)
MFTSTPQHNDRGPYYAPDVWAKNMVNVLDCRLIPESIFQGNRRHSQKRYLERVSEGGGSRVSLHRMPSTPTRHPNARTEPTTADTIRLHRTSSTPRRRSG